MLNKGQRIFFEQSSANGILLFRETSAILCAYGSRILQVPVQQDIYLEKYKGTHIDTVQSYEEVSRGVDAHELDTALIAILMHTYSYILSLFISLILIPHYQTYLPFYYARCSSYA